MKSSPNFTTKPPKTAEQLRAELERTRLEIELLRVKLENAKLRNDWNQVKITVNFDSDEFVQSLVRLGILPQPYVPLIC